MSLPVLDVQPELGRWYREFNGRVRGLARVGAPLCTSHQVGREAADEEAGTPVVTVDGVGFFGRVLTSTPHSAEAIRLFQATSPLVEAGAFAELKRGRGALEFR